MWNVKWISIGKKRARESSDILHNLSTDGLLYFDLEKVEVIRDISKKEILWLIKDWDIRE